MGNVVIGTGSYLPERVVTNQEIQDWDVDYDPARSGGLSLEQWGQKYIGGTSRHWVAMGQGIADLAAEAGRRALLDAGLAAEAVDLIVMATISTHLPQAAANVQAKLGVGGKYIQLDSGCSGFMDALWSRTVSWIVTATRPRWWSPATHPHVTCIPDAL